MKNVIEYKGYFTKVEYSIEDKVLHGRIEGISDLVNFECGNAAEVESSFREAVDDYLAFCEQTGTEPEKPYKGVFNVRLGPAKHRQMAIEAANEGITLNQLICIAVDEKLERLAALSAVNG